MPSGMRQVAPPSAVVMALAPFCAMANQVLRGWPRWRIDERRVPGDAAGGKVAPPTTASGAAVGRLGDAVGLVQPAEEVGWVVGIDLERVQAHGERVC
jgi:hypothetical protein